MFNQPPPFKGLNISTPIIVPMKGRGFINHGFGRFRNPCSRGGPQVAKYSRIAYPRDPSIQIITTFGPKVCKYYLHWAIWIPRDTVPDFPRCYDLGGCGLPGASRSRSIVLSRRDADHAYYVLRCLELSEACQACSPRPPKGSKN